MLCTPSDLDDCCWGRPTPSEGPTLFSGRPSLLPVADTCWRGDASSRPGGDLEDRREARCGTEPLCDIEMWSPAFPWSRGPGH